MVDPSFLWRLGRAVTRLTSETNAPQFRQQLPFELWARCSTWDGVFADVTGATKNALPLEFMGMRPRCDASCCSSIPVGEIWLVEPRSQKYVVVKVS